MTETIQLNSQKEKGINGSTLKIIAIITMLIDHIGAVVLEGYLAPYMSEAVDIKAGAAFTLVNGIFILDMILRLIGRMAFPIFCFLLVEGFRYTHSPFKYALRLLLFALISEIPFDLSLGLTNSLMPEFTYQNVYFTLLIGLLTIWGFDRFPKWYFRVGISICSAVAVHFIQGDYRYIGVIAIVLLYLFRKKSNSHAMLISCTALTVYNLLEASNFFNVWLIKKYNGKRGLPLKYVFYVFYPLHLFILYLIRCMVLNVPILGG